MIINATITSKNQITIPKAVRDLLDVQKNDTLEFIINDDKTVSVQKKENEEIDLGKVIEEQQKIYGSIDTPEVEWGEDMGTEIID